MLNEDHGPVFVYVQEHYGDRKLMKEFPAKTWWTIVR